MKKYRKNFYRMPTEADAKRILYGDLKITPIIDVVRELGIGYGTVYSIRKRYIFGDVRPPLDLA